jgi:hypothetical protein
MTIKEGPFEAFKKWSQLLKIDPAPRLLRACSDPLGTCSRSNPDSNSHNPLPPPSLSPLCLVPRRVVQSVKTQSENPPKRKNQRLMKANSLLLPRLSYPPLKVAVATCSLLVPFLLVNMHTLNSHFHLLYASASSHKYVRTVLPTS